MIENVVEVGRGRSTLILSRDGWNVAYIIPHANVVSDLVYALIKIFLRILDVHQKREFESCTGNYRTTPVMGGESIKMNLLFKASNHKNNKMVWRGRWFYHVNMFNVFCGGEVGLPLHALRVAVRFDNRLMLSRCGR